MSYHVPFESGIFKVKFLIDYLGEEPTDNDNQLASAN